MKLIRKGKRLTCFLICVVLSLSLQTVQASEESPEAGMKANSWRYENGNLIVSEENNSEENISLYATDSPSHPNGTRLGIDVSEWQEEIDWEKVKADGVDFAIIRCGWGMDFESQDDKWWERNVSECERLGIPYGVYIYSYADSIERAKSEAQHVLRLIEGHNLSYPVFYDMEDSSTIGADLAAIATTFCDIIEDAGYPVGIYANLNWWNNYLTDECFDNWYRWVAQYYTSCNYKGDYTMWQFTSQGFVDGIDGYCDMNWQIGYPEEHGYIGSYIDVSGSSWYANAVSYMYSHNLMTGLDNTTFGPGEPLARAQFAVIMHRFENEPDVSFDYIFPDVEDEEWYTDAIIWANSIGIVTGYTDTGLFCPGNDITREEIATMMYRYAKYKEYNVDVPGEITVFEDADQVSDYANDAVEWCIGSGIITGKDGLIAPRDYTNRAECATIIMRFMEYYNIYDI